MSIRAGQTIRASDLTPTDWQGVSFQNGWTHLGGGWQLTQYRYNPFTGMVELRGSMRGGTLVGGTVVFTLPAGFRPASIVSAPVGKITGGTTYDPSIRIRPDGAVETHGMGSSTDGAQALDGIAFPAER